MAAYNGTIKTSLCSLLPCFQSTACTALVPFFHPWIIQYSMKGSFSEHYIRVKLLMATQKPCKWAVREAHQSSCQMRSPIIIYGHNWPVFPQAMTVHWWIWWWLCSTIRKQSEERRRRRRGEKVCMWRGGCVNHKRRKAVLNDAV